MEHAVPEQFWVDKSQCRYENEQGQIQNPNQADCAQGVSAVKAIAIAQAEGQRIYTIDPSNAATALPKLPVGGTVGQEIQSAIQAGKAVTFHERQINAHGFSGYGYVITDPETGGGAYLIEGKGNGGSLSPQTEKMLALISGLALGISIGVTSLLIGKFAAIGIVAIFVAIILTILFNYYVWSDNAIPCFAVGSAVGASITRLARAKDVTQFFERLFLLVTGAVVGSQVPRVGGCI